MRHKATCASGFLSAPHSCSGHFQRFARQNNSLEFKGEAQLTKPFPSESKGTSAVEKEILAIAVDSPALVHACSRVWCLHWIVVMDVRCGLESFQTALAMFLETSGICELSRSLTKLMHVSAMSRSV